MTEDGYVYTCSDGRMRYVYKENGKITSKSYPRMLMEEKLGRKLEDDEDVHHIDGNPLNNDIENLEIKKHGLHQKEHSTKYEDQIVKCFYCGKEFLWTAKAQLRFHGEEKRIKNIGKIRHVFCSKSCSGKYGRELQLQQKQKKDNLIFE